MKKALFLICSLLLVASISCPKKEFDVTIKLSNGQGKAVPFSGYYMLTSLNDSVSLSGSTPMEYNFTVKSGELVKGSVYKNSTDLVDTLRFELLLDEETKASQSTVNRLLVITFELNVL